MRVDVWSLGATVWELMESEPPFERSKQLASRWPPLQRSGNPSAELQEFLRLCSNPPASRPPAAALLKVRRWLLSLSNTRLLMLTRASVILDSDCVQTLADRCAAGKSARNRREPSARRRRGMNVCLVMNSVFSSCLYLSAAHLDLTSLCCRCSIPTHVSPLISCLASLFDICCVPALFSSQVVFTSRVSVSLMLSVHTSPPDVIYSSYIFGRHSPLLLRSTRGQIHCLCHTASQSTTPHIYSPYHALRLSRGLYLSFSSMSRFAFDSLGRGFAARSWRQLTQMRAPPRGSASFPSVSSS